MDFSKRFLFKLLKERPDINKILKIWTFSLILLFKIDLKYFILGTFKENQFKLSSKNMEYKNYLFTTLIHN